MGIKEVLFNAVQLNTEKVVPSLISIALLTIVAIIGVKIIAHLNNTFAKRYHNKKKAKVIVGLIQTGFVILIVLLMLTRVGAEQSFIKLLGLVLTGIVAFSSTSVILNFMSGLIIQFSKPFSIGDVIEVKDILGKVIEIKPTFIELRSFDKTNSIIPNSLFVTEPVKNYSRDGYRISVTVGLGYDIHRKKAEQLLAEAAHTLHLGKVYVSVTDLGSHEITYALQGTSRKPDAIPFIESDLRKTILDKFAENKVEILSPTIIARRNIGRVIPREDKETKKQETKISQSELVKDTFPEQAKAQKKAKKSKKKKR